MTSLSIERFDGMREDYSRLRHITKTGPREDKSTATKVATRGRVKRDDLQTGANTTSSFLASQLLSNPSNVSNTTKTAKINTPENRNNQSRGQRKSKVSMSGKQPIILQRSPGMNPCVKKIVKTFNNKLQIVLTEYKCRRATFYCSPKLSGLGRCTPVKTFYANINKVLTTGCKCS